MHCTIVTETSKQKCVHGGDVKDNQDKKPDAINTNSNQTGESTGNKNDMENKSTSKSTTKSTLKIFVSPLTVLQITILELLGLSTTVYSDLEKCFICPSKIIKSRSLYNRSRENDKELNEKPLSEELFKYFDDG
jgi:hypothetical protein